VQHLLNHGAARARVLIRALQQETVRVCV
jgi:hypothetical protein